MTVPRRRLRRLLALVVLACVVPPVAVGDGGLSPGVTVGGGGVIGPRGAIRYVAFPQGTDTLVAAIRVRDGHVLRWRKVKGGVGSPYVAYDGTTDGISGDGRTLVLASFATIPAPGVTTRFAVLRLPSLRPLKTIVLPGLWSFDAISPDGATLYAIEYLSSDLNVEPAYRVRAIDVARGRPVRAAIVDRREPDEAMRGYPLRRTFDHGRRWAYTLYLRPEGTLFVHALDTVRGRAVCIDLPWHNVENAAWRVRMTWRSDRTLALTQLRVGLLATIDLRAFEVRPVRRPRK